MRRVTIFISLLLFAVATKAQTVEDIVEAYRQGLIGANKKYGQDGLIKLILKILKK